MPGVVRLVVEADVVLPPLTNLTVAHSLFSSHSISSFDGSTYLDLFPQMSLKVHNMDWNNWKEWSELMSMSTWTFRPKMLATSIDEDATSFLTLVLPLSSSFHSPIPFSFCCNFWTVEPNAIPRRRYLVEAVLRKLLLYSLSSTS